MSVFTSVDRRSLQQFLAAYDVGELIDHRGISAGVENTNYYVSTGQGEYVLTLFESLSSRRVHSLVSLLQHLAKAQFPSPVPIADKRQRYLSELMGRPATLMTCLPGGIPLRPTASQCVEVGRWLARLHIAGQGFGELRENDRGLQWWTKTAEDLYSRLSQDEGALLMDELAYQQQFDDSGLPAGLIHADLFHDNALFENDRLTGVVDFSCACRGAFLYDLAITVNDWCRSSDGGVLDAEKVQAMLSAYHRERSLSEDEHQAWRIMLRAAALRFWLSRLVDSYQPKEGELTHVKDPELFRQLLVNHRVQQGEGLWL